MSTKKHESNSLDFTPLLDLLTATLIFYLFTTIISLSRQIENLDIDRTITLNLAKDQRTGQGLEGYKGTQLYVIKENKEIVIQIEGNKIKLKDLGNYVKTKNIKESLIYIQPNIPHQITISILNILNQSGVQKVSFGYRKEELSDV